VVNRAADAVPDTKGQVEELGARCEFIQGDIGKAKDRKRLVDTTRENFGRCDMLVNNAGVAPLKSWIFSNRRRRASSGSSGRI